MSEWKIREVREEDAGELARIYSWYVLNTAVFQAVHDGKPELRENNREVSVPCV